MKGWAGEEQSERVGNTAEKGRNQTAMSAHWIKQRFCAESTVSARKSPGTVALFCQRLFWLYEIVLLKLILEYVSFYLRDEYTPYLYFNFCSQNFLFFPLI